jgi:hypothetical protein
MKKHIKAIFKGQDGSLGYKKDFEYDLWIERSDTMKNEIRIIPMYQTKVEVCNYSNILTFLDNWDTIRVIK